MSPANRPYFRRGSGGGGNRIQIVPRREFGAPSRFALRWTTFASQRAKVGGGGGSRSSQGFEIRPLFENLTKIQSSRTARSAHSAPWTPRLPPVETPCPQSFAGLEARRIGNFLTRYRVSSTRINEPDSRSPARSFSTVNRQRLTDSARSSPSLKITALGLSRMPSARRSPKSKSNVSTTLRSNRARSMIWAS